MTILAMTVLLGMSALVLDVGTWFQAQRKLQAAADAAALAGAQALPGDPAEATRLAVAYADENGGGVSADGVSISSAVLPSDEITVHAETRAPGFFSRVVDISSVDVGARATARAQNLASARFAAPIAVSEQHPLLRCQPSPCFDQPTEIPLANLDEPGGSTAAGSFGLIDLDPSDNGSVGTSVLAGWLSAGFDGLTSAGQYDAVPGAAFNSSQVQAALSERVGDELLFPVYRTITGSGSNARYDVIGWVGFTLTSFSSSGSSGTLTGRFTRVTWDGVAANGPSQPDFGVRTISLVR
jgi:hypothetical protein